MVVVKHDSSIMKCWFLKYWDDFYRFDVFFVDGASGHVEIRRPFFRVLGRRVGRRQILSSLTKHFLTFRSISVDFFGYRNGNLLIGSFWAQQFEASILDIWMLAINKKLAESSKSITKVIVQVTLDIMGFFSD
ncbi:hypothetical protein RCL_jg25214.t2 [Rhizophagus clarus]|uniref:Uncharacterized protein n=1 Tax=Rhizophagus clarus TaxID=94130 RepID=A0A8H3LWB0_9GLOM|nr:hypothetical protein RCL_jg25214.t2 [Rhizophagus clarus]